MDQLAQHIESIVFVSESPISLKEIKVCLEEAFETKIKKLDLEKAIEELKTKYQEDHYSFEFLEIADGYQFLTKPAFHNSVGTLLKQTNRRRLSKAALETLSIIAYKQPVPKSELEKIRGVSCDYSVQKLLEKELIAIVGRSDSPGRPLLYGTSEKFMEYFGLKNIADMPKPKDFKDPDNEIGEQAPIDETAEVAPKEEQVEDGQPAATEAIPTESIEGIPTESNEAIPTESNEIIPNTPDLPEGTTNRLEEDTSIPELSEQDTDYEILDTEGETPKDDEDNGK